MWRYDELCPVARVGLPARPHAFFGPLARADSGRYTRDAVNARVAASALALVGTRARENS